MAALAAVYAGSAALAASAGSNVTVTILGPSAAISSTTGISVTVSGFTPLVPATSLQAGQGTASQTIGTAGSAATGAPASGSTSVAATGGTSGLLSGASASPGTFVVAGEAGQAFTITMPTQLLVNTPNGMVLLKDFRHSAGTTPAVLANGRVQIAFGANIETDPAEVLPLLATASGDTENVLVLEVQSASGDGAVRRVTGRRINAFAIPDDTGDGIMVLISYN
ncbi:MAG: DUF4402 domain-containing protein [Alphaproteobacteria bacterium]